MSCCEKDHALYRETAGVRDRLREAFPHAERIVAGYLHAELGRPMMELHGVEVDSLDAIPDDLQLLTVRGGLWNAVSYAYPRGADWELDPPYTPRFRIDALNHPRAFLHWTHSGSAPSSEVWCPVRLAGDRVVQIVERPVTRLVGKKERPPADPVTDAEMEAIRGIGPASRRGSCTYAFHYEMHGELWFFQKPVIKGAEVAEGCPVPPGMTTFTLEGGRYARISETRPNGGYDWAAPLYAFREMEKETGYRLDLSRLFFVEETDFGRQFVLYVPVMAG